MAWKFGRKQSNGEAVKGAAVTVREVITAMRESIGQEQQDKPIVPLAHGDPSSFRAFRAPSGAEDALVDALTSGNYNSYTVSPGLVSTRRSVAEYVGRCEESDVLITSGCMQAIEVVIEGLARCANNTNNILLPRPGFPYYECRCAWSGLKTRHFDLLPNQGWEVDLSSVEAACDSNTVAMVIINPGNPTGAVYSSKHLEQVARIARKLGIMVISDEVYNKLTFPDTPSFVPMSNFASIAPVLTLGSISKTFSVPGWRLGWIVINDPDSLLGESGVIKTIIDVLKVTSDPASFIQAALPRILFNKTNNNYISNMVDLLAQNANMCYHTTTQIPCLSCPHKPQGSMFIMLKLDTLLLDGVANDVEFCLKLAKEESVMILPGEVVGMKGWLRVSFAVEPSILEDGIQRLKSFCQRHSKDKHQLI